MDKDIINTQDAALAALNKSILADYQKLMAAIQERNFFITQETHISKRLDTLA